MLVLITNPVVSILLELKLEPKWLVLYMLFGAPLLNGEKPTIGSKDEANVKKKKEKKCPP